MINDEADEVIKEVFDHLKIDIKIICIINRRQQVCLYFQLLYYKCHKINPDRGGTYIDPLDWVKNKKTTINPINKKDSTFNTL